MYNEVETLTSIPEVFRNFSKESKKNKKNINETVIED